VALPVTLKLTPERLASVYEMLRAFQPFCWWRLPPASDVKFHVARTRKRHALWWIEGDTHHIEISATKHGWLSSLVETMAHEMIHVRQRVAKTETRGVEHNAEFMRIYPRVCARLGFDPGQFLG